MKFSKEDAVIIFNIPTHFGAMDLRRFFTTFIEAEKFDCFHYKRRPEKKLIGFNRDMFLTEASEDTTEKNLAIAVLSARKFVQPFLGTFLSRLICME